MSPSSSFSRKTGDLLNSQPLLLLFSPVFLENELGGDTHVTVSIGVDLNDREKWEADNGVSLSSLTEKHFRCKLLQDSRLHALLMSLKVKKESYVISF